MIVFTGMEQMMFLRVVKAMILSMGEGVDKLLRSYLISKCIF